MNLYTPVVTKLRVARLFNLGDYEHERIEVTVEARGYELQDGSIQQCELVNPSETLQQVRDALEACKPVPFGYSEQEGRNIELGLTVVWDGNGETPKDHWHGVGVAQDYVESWKAYQAAKEKQKAAIERLNKLGTVTQGGAK